MGTADKGPASLGKAAVAATGDDESDARGIMIDVAAGGSFTIIKATACGGIKERDRSGRQLRRPRVRNRRIRGQRE